MNSMEEHDELFLEISQDKLGKMIQSYWRQMKEYTIVTNGMAGIKLNGMYFVLDHIPIQEKLNIKFEEVK